MKKYLLSLAMIALACTANAQFVSNNQEAFRHVAIGVEAGSMGAGVNIAMPIVTDHLVLVLGYNFPQITYKRDIDISVGGVNADINRLNSKINEMKGQAGQYGVDVNLSELNQLNGKVKADAKLDMVNMKAMLEYYPWSFHTFHIVAGVMIGNDQFIQIEGHSSKNDWSVYNSLQKNISEANSVADRINSAAGKNVINKLDANTSVVSFDFDDKTYRLEDLDKDGTGDIKGSLVIKKVKPYFGVGFGRSVPKKRLAVQFELGAWIHGTPELIIDNPTTTAQGGSSSKDAEKIVDAVKKINFFPQIAIRLNGRLF